MKIMIKKEKTILRAVRCKITGEYGTIDTFYKAPDGKYYKSKEIYQHEKNEKNTETR